MKTLKITLAICFFATESVNAACKAAMGASLKRGIAYEDASVIRLFTNVRSWAYNWRSSAGELDANIEYVPMLHGGKAEELRVFVDEAKNEINQGAKFLLAMNEPDIAGQANLEPGRAADIYKDYLMKPFGGGKVKLIAPAITSTQDKSAPLAGLGWLEAFRTACRGCQIDGYAFHWTGAIQQTESKQKSGELQAKLFMKYADRVMKTVDRPCWWTELVTEPKEDMVINSAFYKVIIPYLDNHEKVFRYAGFFAAENYLVKHNNLSASGIMYNTKEGASNKSN